MIRRRGRRCVLRPVLMCALLSGACAGTGEVPQGSMVQGADSSSGGAVPDRPCPTPPAQLAADGAMSALSVACLEGDPAPCVEACEQGNGEACATVGTAMQRNAGAGAEALPYFFRGCELGEANACTNYGATIRQGYDGVVSEAELRCSLELFERACEVEEVWACGMLGQAHVAGEGTAADPERGERILVGACERIGYFACAVLGTLYQHGQLQPPDDGAAARALTRACETGYDDACLNR